MIPQPPTQTEARSHLGAYKKAAADVEKAHLRVIKAGTLGDALYALRGLLEATDALRAVLTAALDSYGMSNGFPPVIDHEEVPSP